MNEIVREFLLETHENLAQLDLDLVTLEKDPGERETLARVFRTLHTVKGTAGFLGLPKLQTVAHAAENLLSRLRAGELLFQPDIASGLLAAVDAIRQMLASIEATEKEGDGDFTVVIQNLERLTKGSGVRPAASKSVVDQPVEAVSRPAPPSVVKPVSAVAGKEERTDMPRTIAGLPPEAVEARPAAVADSSIRVDVGVLDKMMTLVGELVLARNQILQYSAAQEDHAFLGAVQRLNLLTSELQAGVMKTRMQPIGNVWTKFPRLVRDLAVACGKQVRLEMEGQETELDRTILESIRDPLTHMVRNAIDHGIETPIERQAKGKPAEGRLHLRASHESGKVVIEIQDDGAGIDAMRVREKAIARQLIAFAQAARMSEHEIVNLIFLPGFSTADAVTQFSGRGVGLDVVRTNIEKIGGTVEIENRPHVGAAFRMKIPLTLAIIPALTISAAGDRYAIPQASVVELIRLDHDTAHGGVEFVQDAPVYRLRGQLLPVIYLRDALKVSSDAANARTVNSSCIVVLQAEDRQFGLVVDAIQDSEEIVVKPLQKQIKSLGVYSGATIMGDGRVALILDVLGLAQATQTLSAGREQETVKTAATVDVAVERHAVVVFAPRGGGRMAIPLAQVARLEEIPRSNIERAGNRFVVQYRGEILPLIDVARALRRRRPRDEKARTETLQVIVCSLQGKQYGLVVASILDIVEEGLLAQSSSTVQGVRLTAVIQGKVTELLDVEKIISEMEPSSA